MKISLNWLKNYVDLKGIPERELLERLTLSTCEVEGVRKLDEHIKETVVGEIVEIQNHPNADKLRVCAVRIKNRESRIENDRSPSTSSGTKLSLERSKAESKGNIINIVCGGTNLCMGAKVVAALPGASVKWHGESQWTELKETEIRGVKSFGMICAAEELEIPWRITTEDGERPIMVLPVDAPVGQSVSEYFGLNDTVLDIDNKSITHRADLFSHVGIASELGAIFKLPIQDPRYSEANDTIPDWEALKKKKHVTVDIKAKDGVKRSTFLLLKGLGVQPSPLWMQNRLRAIGMRPINNLVDATNYVMWEVGTPLHAFDVAKISGGKMIVRFAKEGETVMTLDGVERKLDSTILVGEDGDGRLIDLPGIMGGLLSEVDEGTTSILLQSAAFDRVVIRKSTLKLAHRTDGAAFHERAADPNLTIGALLRTFGLLKETCPEVSVVQVIDEYPEPAQDRELEFDPGQIQKQLGVELAEKESKRILERLGFIIKESSNLSSRASDNERGDLVQTRETRLLRKARNDNHIWKISVPARRKDIFGFQDICEEVGRIYGYDNIAPKEHSAPLESPVIPVTIQTREMMRDMFCRQGFHEVYQYTFLSERDIQALKIDPETLILIQNPISEDLKYLRPGMLPSFLKTIEKNEGRYGSFSLFEIGKVFAPVTQECERAGGVIYGGNQDDVLLRRAFGMFDEMTRVLKLPKAYEREVLEKAKDFVSSRWLVKDSSVSVVVDGRVVGVVGLAKPKTAAALGVKGSVAYFEFDLEVLSELREIRWEYARLPAFPSVLRDIALVVDDRVSYEQVAKILGKADNLSRLELFDVFSGKGIAEGKKSLAFHLEFGTPERTLTSKEVDESMEEMIDELRKKLSVMLRS